MMRTHQFLVPYMLGLWLKRHTRPDVVYDEDQLLSRGMVALWRCCRLFDVNRGVKFSCYAGRAINTEFNRWLYDKMKSKSKPCMDYDPRILEANSPISDNSEVLATEDYNHAVHIIRQCAPLLNRRQRAVMNAYLSGGTTGTIARKRRESSSAVLEIRRQAFGILSRACQWMDSD